MSEYKKRKAKKEGKLFSKTEDKVVNFSMTFLKLKQKKDEFWAKIVRPYD